MAGAEVATVFPTLLIADCDPPLSCAAFGFFEDELFEALLDDSFPPMLELDMPPEGRSSRQSRQLR
eukprot:2144168-Ditylum_brightwellii.AAC.1